MSEQNGTNGSKQGKPYEQATSLDGASSVSSAKTNDATSFPPRDYYHDLFGSWEANTVLRTMEVDASQIAGGGGLGDSPPNRPFSQAAMVANNNNSNNSNNMEMNDKAYEPISFGKSRSIPLINALQLQTSSGLTTLVADAVARRDGETRADADAAHPSRLMMAMSNQHGNANHQAFAFGTQPRQYENANNSARMMGGSSGNMQQTMEKGNFDPSLFVVNGAPAGFGSIGWCTNLPNPHYYSLPGTNNGLPWTHAQAHPFGGHVVMAANQPNFAAVGQHVFRNTNPATTAAMPLNYSRGSVHDATGNSENMANQSTTETSVLFPLQVTSRDDVKSTGGNASGDNNDKSRKLLINPSSRDVCFALIKHPGTKAWRTLVDSLANQADVNWSGQICELIKKQLHLEGRRFLVCETKKGSKANRKAGGLPNSPSGTATTTKIIKNGNWCIASPQEIFLRTRQRFRDCRKGKAAGADPKTARSRRPSELKASKDSGISSLPSSQGTGGATAPGAIELSVALNSAINQCQLAVVNQTSSIIVASLSSTASIEQKQQQQRLIQKGERAKERLELLTPMESLRWSHVLEQEMLQEQRQTQHNINSSNTATAWLNETLVMERGRAALRIKKLKKAETQMVQFIQTLMDSDSDNQEGSVGGTSSSRRDDDDDDDTDDNNSHQNGGDDDDDEEGSGGDGGGAEDGDDGDEKQNGNDNQDSEETDSEEDDEDMEDGDDEDDEAESPQKKKISLGRQRRMQHKQAASSVNVTGYYLCDLVTVFQAAPLGYRLKSGEAHPLPLLDIEYEKSVLTEAFQDGSRQSGKRIDIDYEVATTERIAKFLVNNESRVMHLSCHGHPDYLALDNGWGGMQILHVQVLEQFIRFGAGNLDLVFLSSCSSRPAGEIFVAAGVSHVVCCYQSHRPRDVVAIEFSKNFYRALAAGKTIKVAFEQARHFHQVSSSLANQTEAEQFLLLPEKPDDDPYHDVHIFAQRTRRFPGLVIPKLVLTKSFPYLPRPTRSQTLHMYHVLELLSKANVVKVSGVDGAKRLAASLAGYIRVRPETMNIDRMYWLPPMARADDDASQLLQRVCNIVRGDSELSDDELMSETTAYRLDLNEALSYMVNKRCLFVINGRRFASESQSRRLEQLMCDLIDGVDAKIILACSKGQEQSNGPQRYQEQLRVYRMINDDKDCNLPPVESAIIPTPKPAKSSGNSVVEQVNRDDDDDSMSDLSTFSAQGRKRMSFEQTKTPHSNGYSHSEIPHEIVSGFQALLVDDTPEYNQLEPASKRKKGIGAPVKAFDNVNSRGHQEYLKTSFHGSTFADDASTACESSVSGGRFPKPKKTLDAFDATMGSFVEARISRGMHADENGQKLALTGASSIPSAVTPFLKRYFTDRLRVDSSGRPCLYGRDNEVSILRDAYARISLQGARSEIVVVHGPSGTGKSTLVKHVVDFLAVDRNGIYAMGKFDEMRCRAKPYSAIVDALSRLVGRLSKSDDMQVVKTSLRETLGSELKVLADLIPALSQFATETTTWGEYNVCAGNGYAFTRFKDLFRSFLRAVSCHSRPILLFLDDLQWADNASLELLESLATDPESSNVLFVWAYRDNENGERVPSRASGVAKASSSRLSDIPIGEIDPACLNQVVAHLAQKSTKDVKPLSDLLYRRTGGNIHFALQFLQMLQHDGLLVFSDELQKWEWNIELIDLKTVPTENVAHLLTANIERQPRDVQALLQLASFLGFFFDVKLLESLSRAEGIVRQDSEEFDSSTTELWNGRFLHFLKLAKRENFIFQTNDPRLCRFSHDRVRQCAYETVRDEEQREQLHLRIGTLIWTQIQPESSDDLLPFLAVDQLNRGSRHLKDDDARIKLAKLNLNCAKTAGLNYAFPLAADLLERGIRLLNHRTMWLKNTYRLCLELHNSSAEMECCLGNFENSDDRVETVLARALNVDDKMRAYYVRIDSFAIRRKLEEGINEGIKILSLIGEKLPRRPGMLNVLLELGKTKRALKGRSCDEIRRLPSMKDERKIAAMRILSSIALSAWHRHNNSLLGFVFLRMTKITLNHGLCKYSPFAFAAFGMIHGSVGDTAQAVIFGTLALQLLEVANAKDCSCSTMMMVCVFVEHLKKPLSSVALNLMEAYQLGMEQGDVQYACLSLSAYGGLNAVTGKPLHTLMTDLGRHRRVYQEYNQDHVDVLTAPWLQFALNMSGQADNVTVLTGAAMDEEVFMSEADSVAKMNVHFIRMILLYVLGYIDAAGVELDALENLQGYTEGTHFMTTFIVMYCGLVSLALAQHTRRRRYIAGAKKYINHIAKYAKEGRVNCPPLLNLLLAIQKISIADKSSKAAIQKSFDEAIAQNASCGFLPFEAIANEMVGEFMMSCHEQSLGRVYLHRAWQLYTKWDAVVKVQLLETKYKALRTMPVSPTHPVDQGATMMDVTSTARTVDLY